MPATRTRMRRAIRTCGISTRSRRLPRRRNLPQPPFDLASPAKTAREFLQELAAKHLATIRQRTRAHAEQTWLGAVTAMRGTNLPPLPQPPFAPAMEVEVPSEQLTAQWNLGAWHLLRHSVKDAEGRWRFNDFPFGILASETYMILRALDLQGMHREAADGLDQWLEPAPAARPGQQEPTPCQSPTGPSAISRTGSDASPMPSARTARADTWTRFTAWGRAPSCSLWPSISGSRATSPGSRPTPRA